MCAAFAAGGVLLTLSTDLPEHRRRVMLDEAGKRIDAPDAAYVFFTSGSTGKPKGVIGTHAGLAHWLAWQRATMGVGPGDRCGQLTGLSFDVVLRDVFLPLTSGATLVLPTEDASLQWLERERITLIAHRARHRGRRGSSTCRTASRCPDCGWRSPASRSPRRSSRAGATPFPAAARS